MTAIDEACAELAAWLPHAEARIHLPDTDGTASRTQPTSRPPWNGAVAMALFDALEGVRQLEASWRTGPPRPMAATGATIASITRLAHAQPDGEQRQAVILITRLVTPILQHPAIDEAERPLSVPAGCPYCRFGPLWAYPRSRRVACLRGAGVCEDSDGNPPRGLMVYSQRDGTPQIEWQDGLVT